MFLSQVTVDTHNPQTLIDVLKADAYGLHQLLWRLFPDQPDAKRDFLFRRDERRGMPVFYLLSNRKPQALPGQLSVESKHFAPKLQEGDRLAFTLRVNPVRTRKVDEHSKKRKRDDLVMHLKQTMLSQGVIKTDLPSKAELSQQAGEMWLSGRTEKMGVVLESLRADGYLQHHFKKKGHVISISTLDLEGVVTVSCPAIFLEKLYQGIGPAKAFGCGLMLVRRI